MSRFIIEKSKMQPNSWVLTDKSNNIVVVFEDGKFNETQHVSPLDDTISERLDVGDIAHIMQEIGEWASKYHSSKCFSKPYGLEYDESERLCLYRRKHPKWRLHLYEEVNTHELAASLKKAAEYLTKGMGHG